MTKPTNLNHGCRNSLLSSTTETMLPTTRVLPAHKSVGSFTVYGKQPPWLCLTSGKGCLATLLGCQVVLVFTKKV